MAAAVILEPGTVIEGVDDSKRLTPAERDELDAAIDRLAYELYRYRPSVFLSVREALAGPIGVRGSLVRGDFERPGQPAGKKPALRPSHFAFRIPHFAFNSHASS